MMTLQPSSSGASADAGTAIPLAPDGAILALDLGTTTGWAVRAPGGLITSGTVSFRPSRMTAAACVTSASLTGSPSSTS